MDEMLKGLVGKLIVNLTAISVLIFAVGCLVMASHLNKYSLNDFEVFRPKAVTVGMMCAIIFVLHTSILFYLLHLTEKRLAGQLIIVVSYFLIAFQGLYIHLDGGVFFDDHYLKTVYGKPIWLFREITCMFSPLWGLTGVVSVIANVQVPMSRFWRITALVCNYVFFISALITIAIFWNNRVAKDLILFEGVLCSLFAFLCIAKWMDSSSANKIGWFKLGKANRNPLFKESDDTIARRRTFASVYIITVTVAGVLALCMVYANWVFPHINEEYGGGKFREVTYVTNEKTVTGMKILETPEYVFLLQDDDKIVKVSWAEIQSLRMAKD